MNKCIRSYLRCNRRDLAWHSHFRQIQFVLKSPRVGGLIVSFLLLSRFSVLAQAAYALDFRNSYNMKVSLTADCALGTFLDWKRAKSCSGM